MAIRPDWAKFYLEEVDQMPIVTWADESRSNLRSVQAATRIEMPYLDLDAEGQALPVTAASLGVSAKRRPPTAWPCSESAVMTSP